MSWSRWGAVGVMLLILLFTARQTHAADGQNPIYDAEVGEYVTYKLQGDISLTMLIVKVTDAAVTYETTMGMPGGKKTEPRTNTVPRTPKVAPGPDGTIPTPSRTETVTVHGRRLTCEVYVQESPQGMKEAWIAMEVPVLGLVKAITGDQVEMELIEFGTTK